MIPSEQIRNCNQRLIPLTAELIQDMLDNEGREFQTPPGGHTCEPADDSYPNMNDNNANQLKETSSSDGNEPSILKRSLHYPHRRHRKNNVLTTGNLPGLSSKSDDESDNWKSLIEIMQSAQRLKKVKDSEKKLDTCSSSSSKSNSVNNTETEPSDTCSNECLRINPSKRRLFCSSSESLISKPSNHLEEIRDLSLDNFHSKNLHWINMVVVPKSETSFLMNQQKLENYKTNSCNAYYTPIEKDFIRDREAAAVLLARPR